MLLRVHQGLDIEAIALFVLLEDLEGFGVVKRGRAEERGGFRVAVCVRHLNRGESRMGKQWNAKVEIVDAFCTIWKSSVDGLKLPSPKRGGKRSQNFVNENFRWADEKRARRARRKVVPVVVARQRLTPLILVFVQPPQITLNPTSPLLRLLTLNISARG